MQGRKDGEEIGDEICGDLGLRAWGRNCIVKKEGYGEGGGMVGELLTA